MLLEAAEVDVEFVERGEEFSERRSGCEFREGIHILREAFAAVAEFAVGTRHVGVHSR